MPRETNGAHFVRAANRASMYDLGPAGDPPQFAEDAVSTPKTPDGAAALMRMVDFRIPLPWLLGGFITAIGALIGMYYKLQAVDDTLKEVRTTLAATSEVMQRLTGQQALLQYRIEKLETERHFSGVK